MKCANKLEKNVFFIFLVVVVLIILLSFGVLAAWEHDCSYPSRCVSLWIAGNDCKECDQDTNVNPIDYNNFGSCNDETMSCGAYAVNENVGGQVNGVTKECPLPSKYTVPISSSASIFGATGRVGCFFIAGDRDKGVTEGADDCGVALIKVGQKWGKDILLGSGSFASEYGVISYQEDNQNKVTTEGTDDPRWMIKNMRADTNFEFMCSDDFFWHRCDNIDKIDKNLDEITWANGEMYKCTYDDFVYQWEDVGLDKDNDGWTTKDGDCRDDPAEDSAICSDLAMDLKSPENQGLTIGERRAKVKKLCDGKAKYSQCSICTNPGAAEMCGDTADNDCKAETSDNCHENQASCEQRNVGSCSENHDITCYEDSTICKDEDAGECTFVQEGEAAYGYCENNPDRSCSDDNPCGDVDGPTCVPVAQGTAYNIYNEEFSWIDTKEGGYCCGYQGVDDAGKIAQNKDLENLVCLNKNKQVVSTEKGFAAKDSKDGIGIDEIFKNSNCKGKWCWINSAPANNQFKVFTIKRPGKQPYDVVSNKDKWLVCNATTSEAEKTFKAGAIADPDLKKKSNRFYCYQEGDRWSWAECVGAWEDRANPSIKGRYTGEGLYALPLSIIQSPQEPPETPAKDNAYLRETLEGPTIPITYDSLYKKYYGKGFLDFTGYTHLNLMVQFVGKDNKPAKVEDLKFPLAIDLTVLGPKDKEVVYLQRNILGDVINAPFADINNEDAAQGYMHIRASIGEYRAVRGITITANAGNRIKVRNIYLTSDKPGASNLLCSGQGAQEENAWLPDADAGSPDAEITGENLCRALYGKKAWLGQDDEISESVKTANCCGNFKNEYYAGLSNEYVPAKDEQGEAAYYGCWNSQPIASGDTIMDVQFKVTSQDTSYDVTYKGITLPAVQEIVYTSTISLEEDANIFCPTVDCKYAENCKASTCDGQPNPGGTCTVFAKSGDKDNVVNKCTAAAPADFKGNLQQSFPCSAEPINLGVGETSKRLCEFTISDLGVNPETTELGFKDASTELVEVLFYDLVTQSDLGKSIKGWADVNKNIVIPGPAQQISAGQVKNLANHPLAVVARLRNNVYFPAEVKSEQKEKTESVTFSCSKPECLFPLPGSPPYKITNSHPDLYELYYVTGKLPGDETPITQANQEFAQYANLKVKRIAQQALYYNEGGDSTKDIGFYGCRAADFITQIEEKKNLQYCAVIGNKGKEKFCSYSEVHEEENNKDAFTIVNTWSSEGLTQVGYADPLQKPEGQNISAYYETVELALKKQDKLASSRNHSASALPTRNFISNAEFATLGAGHKLPYWEVLVNNQAVEDEKSKYVKENKVTLAAGEALRSERISIPSSANLSFSTAQECTAKIYLIDKDGNSEQAALPQFNTGDASYAIIEFTGACQVEKPSLQLVDELGPAEYSYQSHPELTPLQDARSGAACCPDKYCWNGYACVEPMSTLTTVTEHVADGRDYRCIDGEWQRSALKFDWNSQQWGFCPQESQCFVLGTGKAENTAKSFYDGQYPICINNAEYIFDNYCSQGNWTSRTKFLATKLLEVAENDEYVLYCSPYKQALLDLGSDENKLGGPISVTEKQPSSLPNLKPQPPKTIDTCYKLDPAGKKLVPDSQNTCINNVCVLQYKDGGQFKVAFATTLNRPIADANSFLLALNIPQEKLSQVCKGSGKDFIECNLQGLEFPDRANLYHSDELNAVIFAWDGIKLSPGVADKVLKWFKNLFGSGLLAEKTFVTQAQNFRNLYLANINGKKVRAVEEIFPGVKQTLAAEYQNFDTPVCEYVKNIKVPPELQLELLEKASGVEKIYCTVNGTTQKVVVNAGLDFFWPQLTGKLRIGEGN